MREVTAHKPARDDNGEVFIGYASGTRSHHRDFDSIVLVLTELLSAHDNLRLILLGRIHSDEFLKLKTFRDRIWNVPMVPFHLLPEKLARFDINIAPLETGNVFCEAKSELKYFEAAIVAVPTVASATSTYEEAIIDGKTGYCASTHDEWFSYLTALTVDSDLRSSMGEAARSHAAQRWGPDAQKTALIEIISQCASQSYKRRS